GIAEIGGIKFYKLEYTPSGGGVKAAFFFETGTFRHVMSQYSVTLQPQLGSLAENSKAPLSYYTLTERFSNFAKAGALTLPLNYMIDYSAKEADVSSWVQWNIKIQEVYFNEQLEPSVFKVS
ncbi:MAG: hypothetical protein ACRD6X_04345, partial [Pyrinomonadaceae bacterium]